jgi:hypothetical protein
MTKKKLDDDDGFEDDFDDEEEPEEDEEELQNAGKKKVLQKRPIVEEEEEMPSPIKQKKFSSKENEKTETTYSAYHFPERIGVKNDLDNSPIGEDVYSVLALILTKLEKIESAVC